MAFIVSDRRTKNTFSFAIISLLSLGLLAGCNLMPPQVTASPTPTQPGFGPSSPTPSLPNTPTPTPSTITLWISPAVPEELRDELLALNQVEGRTIEVVSHADSARVRAEPDAETSLATWVYALVAPFPTVDDNLGFETMRTVWIGDAPGNILASAEDIEALDTLLGQHHTDAVTTMEEDSLIDQAWEQREARAIVPFEALEPRWKVLTVDGMSPVHMGFTLDDYALAVRFGLSGEADAVDAFQQALNWPASNLDPERMTVLVMTGTTGLTRGIAYKMDVHGVRYPANLIGDWLREADFTHVCNEVPFTESCPPPDPNQSSLRFCAHPRHVPLLEEIDVDLIELTSNHINDMGTEPLLASLALFRERGWQYFGGGEDLHDAFEPLLIEHNGNRLAFLGCNYDGPYWAWAGENRPGAAPCDMQVLLPEVARLSQEGYLVIFAFHWEEDELYYPLPEMTGGFRQPAKAGAVIVSGSQAHQPMGFEFYNGALIHYGLGNLFFDQMWALEVRQEFIDRHVFYDGRHLSTVLMTAMLEDASQPRPMTPGERAAFLSLIFDASGW
jgi:poly-gamma-glutamate synthesis protein (capsule biosynthesis protein)